MTPSDDLTPLNFLAVLINELQNPDSVSPLWLCMNAPAKQAQINRARDYFAQWKESELVAQRRRQEGMEKAYSTQEPTP